MAKNYYASPSYGNASGGKRWDDGTFSGVKKITVTTTDKTLTSLQVTYALEGHDPSVRMKDFGGLIHGGDGTDKKEVSKSQLDEILHCKSYEILVFFGLTVSRGCGYGCSLLWNIQENTSLKSVDFWVRPSSPITVTNANASAPITATNATLW